MQRPSHVFSSLYNISAGIRRTGTGTSLILLAIAGLAGAMTLQDPPGSPPAAEEVDVPTDRSLVPPDPLLVIAYHSNEMRKRESLYSNGRPEGVWIGWRKDGGLEFRGHYRNGLKHGVWQTYDDSSGTLLEESTYEGGLLHGAWTRYEDGYIVGTGTYEKGRRTGVWTTYRAGHAETTGSYDDGRRVGAWTFWHDRDTKSAEGSYENGLRTGAWTYWKEDGEVDEERTGAYEDGELTKSRRRRTP